MAVPAEAVQALAEELRLAREAATPEAVEVRGARVSRQARVCIKVSLPSPQRLRRCALTDHPGCPQAARASCRTAAGQAWEADAQLAAARILGVSADRVASAEALALLEALLRQGYKPSETLTALCTTHFVRGEYGACRRCLSQLVRSEPSNERAAALLELLVATVRREGRTGLLLLAAGAVLAVGLGVLAYRRWRAPPAHISSCCGASPRPFGATATWRAAAAPAAARTSAADTGEGSERRCRLWEGDRGACTDTPLGVVLRV
jgi:hypothetical protein